MSQRFDFRPSVLYENRYCDLNEFDIIIYHEDRESEDSTNCIIQLESVDVKCNIVFVPNSANRSYAKTAVVGSDIFNLDGNEIKVRKTFCVDIRSKSTWKNLTSMPDSRVYFSVCSFMNSIYLVGGYLDYYSCSYPKGCYKYDKRIKSLVL